MSRKHIAALIVIGWLGALGWLVKREYFPQPGSRFDDVVLNVSPSATYYRIMVGGIQVGYASTTVDTLADTVRQLDITVLQVPAADAPRRIESRIVSNLTRGLALRSFETAYRSEQQRYDASGVVEGDSILLVNLETGVGPVRTTRIPIRGRLAFPHALPLQLAFHGELTVAREYDFDFFDPLLLERWLGTIRVTAESTWVVPDSADLLEGATRWTPATFVSLPSWRVEHSAHEIPVGQWVDGVGHVVDVATPAGYHAERTAYEIAYENFVDDSTATPAFGTRALVHATVIETGLEPPTTPIQTLRLRVGTSEPSRPASFARTFLGDTTIVRQDARAFAAGYRLPSRDSTLRRYLDPEPLIPSDDPRIQSQARQIVGRTTNPGRVARRLSDWVHDNLERRPPRGLWTAVDVLDNRSGDCSEHTVLFVALARALGLPARPVAGLVYVDGRFFYHAWAEVFLDRWVGIDPTFDQAPADAARLRLRTGGLARPMELVKLIGDLELAVLEERTE